MGVSRITVYNYLNAIRDRVPASNGARTNVIERLVTRRLQIVKPRFDTLCDSTSFLSVDDGDRAPRARRACSTRSPRSPEAQLLAGGTDFMVEVNFGHRDPRQVVALRRVRGAARLAARRRCRTLRAGLTYTEMEQAPLADLVPGLAQAARTVGSPQIRNAGRSAATSAPRRRRATRCRARRARRRGRARVRGGDPPRSARRVRHRAEAERPPARRGDPRGRVAPARGPQEFVKVGTRNAMVISVASVALVVDTDAALGALRARLGRPDGRCARPRPRSGSPRESTGTHAASATLPTAATFAAMVAAAARPIDDHRSTAAYRRRADRGRAPAARSSGRCR